MKESPFKDLDFAVLLTAGELYSPREAPETGIRESHGLSLRLYRHPAYKATNAIDQAVEKGSRVSGKDQN
jgi:hypothetical protein